MLTKNYNGRAQILFCSLNLLHSDILVAVIIMVLSSLFLNVLIHLQSFIVLT